jgi:hypothetical protein
MMKNIFSIIIIAALILIVCFISCSKENSQDLSVSASVATCDTVDMKYTINVLPILQAHCYNCHATGNTGASGGVYLDSYASLKVWVDNGYFGGDITHSPGYVGMPYGLPMLDTCDINIIISWLNNGAQNN